MGHLCKTLENASLDRNCGFRVVLLVFFTVTKKDVQSLAVKTHFCAFPVLCDLLSLNLSQGGLNVSLLSFIFYLSSEDKLVIC